MEPTLIAGIAVIAVIGVLGIGAAFAVFDSPPTTNNIKYNHTITPVKEVNETIEVPQKVIEYKQKCANKVCNMIRVGQNRLRPVDNQEE